MESDHTYNPQGRLWQGLLLKRGLKKKMIRFLAPVEEGVIQFVNGRHRTRYMYDAGAKSFPVEVPIRQVELFRHYCVSP